MGALNPGESAPRSCTGSVLQLGAIVALADGVFAEFQRDGLNVNPFASCCMRECCSDILTGFILRDRTAQFLDKSFGRDRERRSSAGAVRPIVDAMVESKANVIVSGATGSGKTTLLSAILGEVSASERILVIEESSELRPAHPHVVHLQIRRANVQGKGEVTMSELVRAAMRMRPDRIVLGECRGAEVRDVLSALNTGHEGGWATVHANSAADVPARLVALGALAGMGESVVAAQASSALDAVLHIERSGSRRRLSQIAVLEREAGELHAQVALECARQTAVKGPGWLRLAERIGV